MPKVTRQTSACVDSDEPTDHPYGFVTLREIDGQRTNVESHSSGAGGAGGPTSAQTMTSSQEAASEEARGRKLNSHQKARSDSTSPGFQGHQTFVLSEIAKIHYKERAEI
ncbi:hypothetical protein PENANT_c045G03380 [Penicillium antarcticum]|uniref:Uncharacterized protein n=1 Tax=Penicillium antarcticum TaxID=416450 RepID=A0A1V6PRR5_9EURO|nr:hypothetical protein PENANT_c045G03380 [Penicillium antarcticum]